MGDEIGIKNGLVDNSIQAAPNSFQTEKKIKASESINNELPYDAKKSSSEEATVKTEILSASDIEIRKLHALRRTKEYLDNRLLEAAEKALKGKEIESHETESVAAMAYNYGKNEPGTLAVRSRTEETSEEPHEPGPPYKAGAAISGYRTYKKETPKAWDVGDMDERL